MSTEQRENDRKNDDQHKQIWVQACALYNHYHDELATYMHAHQITFSNVENTRQLDLWNFCNTTGAFIVCYGEEIILRVESYDTLRAIGDEDFTGLDNYVWPNDEVRDIIAFAFHMYDSYMVMHKAIHSHVI